MSVRSEIVKEVQQYAVDPVGMRAYIRLLATEYLEAEVALRTNVQGTDRDEAFEKSLKALENLQKHYGVSESLLLLSDITVALKEALNEKRYENNN